jgi:hypothetical protein
MSAFTRQVRAIRPALRPQVIRHADQRLTALRHDRMKRWAEGDAIT